MLLIVAYVQIPFANSACDNFFFLRAVLIFSPATLTVKTPIFLFFLY